MRIGNDLYFHDFWHKAQTPHSNLLLGQNASKENFKSLSKFLNDMTFFSTHDSFFLKASSNAQSMLLFKEFWADTWMLILFVPPNMLPNHIPLLLPVFSL